MNNIHGSVIYATMALCNYPNIQVGISGVNYVAINSLSMTNDQSEAENCPTAVTTILINHTFDEQSMW